MVAYGFSAIQSKTRNSPTMTRSAGSLLASRELFSRNNSWGLP